jgi:hypothetical protein
MDERLVLETWMRGWNVGWGMMVGDWEWGCGARTVNWDGVGVRGWVVVFGVDGVVLVSLFLRCLLLGLF